MSWQSTPETHELVVRPFFGRRFRAPDRRTLHLLWPLFQYRQRGGSWDVTALPLFYFIAHMDHYGFLDKDLMVALVLWWGESPDEGNYLTLLPFGGTLRGLLAKDRVVWVLPPLYVRLDDKGTVSQHVLWPVVNWIRGGGHSGWRVWPFYGRYTKRNPPRPGEDEGRLRYVWTFVMWPFYTYQENLLDTDHPAITRVIFPFYGSIESEDYSETTYLWPFFKIREDRKTGTTEYRAPFPFVTYAVGPSERRVDIWPLFGVYRRGDYRRHFVLTPIERYEEKNSPTERWYRFWLLPFWWDYYKIDKSTGATQREFSLWPLVRYERQMDGSVSVHAVAPEWFKDPGGYEKYWGHFFRVYRYYREPDGREESNFLWGVYDMKTDPAVGVTTRRLFGGLVELRRGADGDRLHFFWGLF